MVWTHTPQKTLLPQQSVYETLPLCGNYDCVKPTKHNQNTCLVTIGTEHSYIYLIEVLNWISQFVYKRIKSISAFLYVMIAIVFI